MFQSDVKPKQTKSDKDAKANTALCDDELDSSTPYLHFQGTAELRIPFLVCVWTGLLSQKLAQCQETRGPVTWVSFLPLLSGTRRFPTPPEVRKTTYSNIRTCNNDKPARHDFIFNIQIFHSRGLKTVFP